MFKQEKSFSCGSAVIRSIIKHYKNINIPEIYIRFLTETCYVDGIDEVKIINVLKFFKLRTQEIYLDNISKNKLIDLVSRNNLFVLCVDNWEHWIICLGYSNILDRFLVFDTEDYSVTYNHISYEDLVRSWKYTFNDIIYYNNCPYYGIIVTC